MAIPTSLVAYEGNTQYVEVDGIQDGLTSAYWNAATVTATLLDSTGVAVAPEINNLPLTYLPTSNGNYRGTVAGTFNPVKGTHYSLVITAVQGGVTMKITIKTSVEVRAS